MSPIEIRELRGEMTRAAFAKLLGVTPLTVYRWELDTDHKESRRPQKRLLVRLENLAGGSEVVVDEVEHQPQPQPSARPRPVLQDVSRQAALSVTERLVLLPVFDEILNGHWRSAEDFLVEAITSGVLGSDAATDLTQTANALLKLLWRGDVRGAYATLAPVLRRLDLVEVSADVGLRVHTTAALIFSSPEGKVFSPGRVNAHVAQADQYGSQTEYEYRALLRCAEMWAAFHLGDASLHERLRVRSSDEFKLATASVPRLMAWEIGSVGAILTGSIAEGLRFFQELIGEAQKEELALIEVRGTAFLVTFSLFAADEIHEVEAQVDRALSVAFEHRLEPGYHTMLLNGARAEIRLRQARFEESRKALSQVIKDAQSIQWPPVEIATTLARIMYVTADLSMTRNFCDVLKKVDGSQRRILARASSYLFQGMELFSALDMKRARAAFVRSGQLAQEAGTLPTLQLFAFCLAYYAAIIEDDKVAALKAQRMAERELEAVPFVWMQGTMRLYQAVEASLSGRADEAASHSDAAGSIFRRVGDHVQLALAQRQQAATAFVSGAKGAEELLEQSASEFQTLGIPVPPLYTDEVIRTWKNDTGAGRLKEADGLSLISGPIDRLAVRGLSEPQIIEELFEVLLAYRKLQDGDSWSLKIEEVSADGRSSILQSAGSGEPEVVEEFGDGAGRRFRLGIAGFGEQPEVRLMLGTLVRVASLSLENAALRVLTNPTSSPGTDPVPDLPGFIAASESSQTLVREISRLKRSRATVLIRGESGTGKEVVAHAVHRLSSRAARAFVTFNCAAVPRDLFEGQLFGYKKGAFTGATSNHPGVIRAADGGTLFLDEIGDLPLDVQPKLLRFLENGEVFPLGDTRPALVNVRVVAATHQDLEQMVKAGTFREDLFYRLAVVPFSLLPLRERKDDVLALARHFLKKFTPKKQTVPRLAPDASKVLLDYEWPGNIRELRNVIERSLAFDSEREILNAADLRF